ncbi:MAG: EAL domain-containing protein [Lautropia sp.]|nr:EAL domain-containing protein [Lautropia sp.]
MRDESASRQRLSSRQLAGWVLLLILFSYLVWLFAYPMAYSRPEQVLPYKILASSRGFNELSNVIGPLRDDGANVASGNERLAQKTLWVLARIPADTVERSRVLHIGNEAIAKGDAVILDEFGQALLYAHFSNDRDPVKASRALPGYAITLPEMPLPLPAGHRRFSGEHDLTLVLRLELEKSRLALSLDLWDHDRFVEAQRQIEQQGTMLGSILVMLCLVAFVAGQLMHLRVMRMLALWLGARAAYLMSAGGYLQFWLGTTITGPIGTGIEQMAQISLPCASGALMWSLMESRLKGHRFGAWLHGVSILGAFAFVVSGLLSPEVFAVLLYLVSAVIIVTVVALTVVNLSRRFNVLAVWYLCTPCLDGMAAANTLAYLVGLIEQPLPWLDLRSTTLLAVMNASTAVVAYLAAERSRQLRTQKAAIDALGRYQATYQAIPIALLSFDQGSRIERYNEVSTRLFNVPQPDVVAGATDGGRQRDGAEPAAAELSLIHHDQETLAALNEAFPADLQERIHQDLSSFDEADFVWRLEREDGHRWLRVQARRTDVGHDVSLTDVTEQKQAEHHLMRESQHDKLTGALNRHGLERAATRALASARVGQLAICYLDLDRFKVLNDVFGHQAGDAVLMDVVRRLRSRLGADVEIARMGGDEFAMLLHTSDPPHSLQAYRALDAIAGRPFEVSGKRFAVTASLGVCSSREDSDFERLLDGADRACRDAKRKGRNQVVELADAEPDSERQRHHVENEVLDRLRRTRAFSDFRLAIQPVVGLGDSNRLGGEILLRHLTPDGSLRSPTGLIEAAVYRGEMASIDRWVLGETLRWLSANERNFRALDFISINLSAEALSDEAFKTHLISQVRRYQHVASRLVIEIDEAVAMQDGYMMKRLIGMLRQYGARAALDNVGSGFLNLSAIGEIGVSYLKVDGSFTDSLAHQGAGQAVLRTITVLAHELGIASVAKSVQGRHLLPALESMSVDYGQGQALGAPMALADFEQLVSIGFSGRVLGHSASADNAAGSGADGQASSSAVHPAAGVQNSSSAPR